MLSPECRATLENARRILEREWVQMGPTEDNGDGSYTLSGIVAGPGKDRATWDCLYTAVCRGRPGTVSEAIRALGFGSSREMTAWNDDPATTHEAVLARVDGALA